jgi:hypothetical protein
MAMIIRRGRTVRLLVERRESIDHEARNGMAVRADRRWIIARNQWAQAVTETR